MFRALNIGALALCLIAPAQGDPIKQTGTRGVRELVADLSGADPAVRAQAACDLRNLGDAAADAIQPLVALLGDPAPVPATICR
jgi:hypothetical protein